jgi:hypothetical protein
MIELLYILLICSIFLVFFTNTPSQLDFSYFGPMTMILFIVMIQLVTKAKTIENVEPFIQKTELESLTSLFEYKNKLKYYISTFSTDFVRHTGVSTTLLNHVNGEPGCIFSPSIGSDFTPLTGYKSSLGEIFIPRPNQLIDNFETFSLIFNLSFPNPINNGRISLIKFGSENVCDDSQDCPNIEISAKKIENPDIELNSMYTGFFEIFFDFNPNTPTQNPKITVKIISQEWVYNPDDKTANPDSEWFSAFFVDSKHHTFVFTKESSKVIQLYIDGRPIFQSGIGFELQATSLNSYIDKSVTGNGSSVILSSINPTIINYILPKKIETPNVPVFILHSVGVFKNKALSKADVEKVCSHYTKLVESFTPPQALIDAISMLNDKNRLPPGTCDACECDENGVYTGTGNIYDDPECFKKVLHECKESSDLSICGLVNSVNTCAPKPVIESISDSKPETKYPHGTDLERIFLDKSNREANKMYSNTGIRKLVQEVYNKRHETTIDTTQPHSHIQGHHQQSDKTVDILGEPGIDETDATNGMTDVTDSKQLIINKDDIIEPNIYKHIINSHKNNNNPVVKNSWDIF